MKKSFIAVSSFALLFGGTINSTEGALPSPFCSIGDGPVVVEPELGEPTVVFNESLDSYYTGFSHNIWSGEFSYTEEANSGDYALKVDFDGGWGGIEFNSSSPINYQKVGGIRLAVRGLTSRTDRNLRIYLLTENGRKLGTDVDLEKYLVGGLTPDFQVAEIPIEDLANKNAYIGGMGIQSEFRDSIVIDDVELIAKEPAGLVTFFDDHLHAKFDYWLSNIKAKKDGVSDSKKAISVETLYGWGGFATYSNKPIDEKDFGAITFAIKSTSNFNTFVYLVDEKGRKISDVKLVQNYIYNGTLSSDWKIVWIPLREIASENQTFHGIGIEPDGIGTFWIDEIKVVEKLRWPLPELYNPNLITSPFGDHWKASDNGGYCTDGSGHKLLHTAIDYPKPIGTSVKASHNGVVKYSATDIKWGGYVSIESHGKAFTTTYTHITPLASIDIGKKVKVGEEIGTIANIAPIGSHLHFQLRVSDYDSIWSLRGRLPKIACRAGYSFIEPSFPELFINPELIYWQ